MGYEFVEKFSKNSKLLLTSREKYDNIIEQKEAEHSVLTQGHKVLVVNNLLLLSGFLLCGD